MTYLQEMALRNKLSGSTESRRTPGSPDEVAQQPKRAGQEQIVQANPPENVESTRSGSNASPAQLVAQPKKSRAEYFREYRDREIECPKCGALFKEKKTVKK